MLHVAWHSMGGRKEDTGGSEQSKRWSSEGTNGRSPCPRFGKNLIFTFLFYLESDRKRTLLKSRVYCPSDISWYVGSSYQRRTNNASSYCWIARGHLVIPPHQCPCLPSSAPVPWLPVFAVQHRRPWAVEALRSFPFPAPHLTKPGTLGTLISLNVSFSVCEMWIMRLSFWLVIRISIDLMHVCLQ